MSGVWQTFLTSLGIQVCNVATGVITARLLQPEGRGELAAIMLWPTILAGLGILGTNWALTRANASRPEKEADWARIAVFLGLGQAAVFMVVGYFLVPILLPADKQHLTALTRLFLFFLPLNFVALNLLALDHGRRRWGSYNLVRLSVVLPYIIFLLVFWLAGITQVFWFVVALLGSNLFAAALRLALQWQTFRRGRFNRQDALLILKAGLPFFLAAVSGVAVLQVDKTLVVSLLSSEMVGCYAAAVSFATAHSSLGHAFGVTSFAALANEANPVRQGEYLAQVFRQATLLYLGAGAAVALLSPVAIVPLFGPDFAPAIKPAAILAGATSFLALGQILNEGLRGRGTTWPGIVAQVLGVGAVAGCAWLLVPTSGLTGLAWAATAGALVQTLVLLAAVFVLLPIKPAYLWGLRRQELKLLCGRLQTLLQRTL
jgi:O-antigen/teichoic acid export membrane protein